ncbi:HNH endonuclease domain-containing protein [Vibrio agarivorans]|uniref:HNH endonuclease domain-containing protein n=1 Tax=Vibrio agarivorans TaxID=153622 RepID=UPI00222FAB3E|nr:HNH endonuclease domain-containing protein [Vibrio agarivorans]
MLPQHKLLNIGALTSLFKSTTNSYKYLFFIALIKQLEHAEDTQEVVIDVKVIVKEMLLMSLYPTKYFLLSFGVLDKTASILDDVGCGSLLSDGSAKKQLALAKAQIDEHCDDKVTKKLSQYVVYRLIRPFLEQSLKSSCENSVNKKIAHLSNERFDLDKPIYKIDGVPTPKAVIVHPTWASYLKRNYYIVKSWAELEFIRYLQTRNPNTPAIPNKISAPLKRESLTKQRKIWDEYIKQHGLKCLFTGEPIEVGHYELDHFVPWSYVGHDQHWNLIPITSSVNSAKNNSIPSEHYLQSFVNTQMHFIAFAQVNKKKAVIEDWMMGLQCSETELSMHKENVEKKLKTTVESLIEMAVLQGFNGHWRANR